MAEAAHSSGALALPHQILATRSIIEVAIPPLDYLTEQAQFPLGEDRKARRLAASATESDLAAASPILTWPPGRTSRSRSGMAKD
jgi:hypothetical protein